MQVEGASGRDAEMHHRTHSDSGERTYSEELDETENAATHSATPQMAHGVVDGTATSNQSVFNLINAVLGVGVLGFPYAFKECGLALATCLVFFIGGVTLFSVRLLLLSSQLTGKRTYEEMACHIFGKPGEMIINFCILVINLGAMVSYLNVLADVLSSVSGTIIPPGLEPSRNSVLLGITLLAVLPVSVFVQDAASLACVSISSVTIIFVFTLVMMISAMRPLADRTVIEYWDARGAFVSFPVIAYGFTIHTVIFPVYALLKSPTVPKMNKIVKQATWLCALVYLMVGAGGYLTFGRWTHGDILRNLGAPDPSNPQSVRWLYERLLKLSYGASIVGTVPLVMLPSLSLLTPMLHPYLKLTRSATTKVVAVLFVGLSYLCAVLIPNVEFILGLNGGTSSIMISYILPGLIYLRATSAAHESTVLKIRQVDGWMKWKARGLVVLGVVLGILCTSATLRAVHQEQAVVTLVQNVVDTTKEMEDAAVVGQKTLNVVKAVDAVETANRELGDAMGDTEETLDTLHSTAKQLNQTLNKAGQGGSSLWMGPNVHEKQTAAAYRAVLKTINETRARVEETLRSVQELQTKLRSVAAEIERDRLQKGEADGEADQSRVDSLVKDLTAALGLSVEEKAGFTDHTLNAVQKEFDIAIAALKDTLRTLDQVALVVSKAIANGRGDNSLKELVVSAMEKAIHATQHSALTLDLISNALADTAADQKSELLSLLKIVVEDYAAETASSEGGQEETADPVEGADGTEAHVEKLTKIVEEEDVSVEAPVLNVKEVEVSVKAALNETAGKKQEAVSQAHDAVQRAHPEVAAKAGQITKEIKPPTGRQRL